VALSSFGITHTAPVEVSGVSRECIDRSGGLEKFQGAALEESN
jgi:hypothetical protein